MTPEKEFLARALDVAQRAADAAEAVILPRYKAQDFTVDLVDFVPPMFDIHGMQLHKSYKKSRPRV